MEMFSLDVVLHEPAIPQNAGNIARTCAAAGAKLHLIKPLGFFLSSRHLKRAGLDYWPLVDVAVHSSFDAYLSSRPETNVCLFSAKADRTYEDVCFAGPVSLVFGNENDGLPGSIVDRFPGRSFRIPMRPGVRSLNLAVAASIAIYEALSQNGFPGIRK
ncbi:MAG: tRNA (cytidine(34)-2'-O)-methyltransferase [Candidatus Aminicenantales bacterium]